MCPLASSKYRTPHDQRGLKRCELKDRERWVFCPRQVPDGSTTKGLYRNMVRDPLATAQLTDNSLGEIIVSYLVVLFFFRACIVFQANKPKGVFLGFPRFF